MVTHDVNLALRSADRIIALKRGGILREGSRTEFLDVGLLREVFDTEFHSFAGNGLRAPYVAPQGLVR
jgi:iron complex transport system ATP-binding protein